MRIQMFWNTRRQPCRSVFPFLRCAGTQTSKCVIGAGRRKCLWIFVILLTVYVYIDQMIPVRYMFKNSNVKSACVIPKLDPYHPSVMQFMWKPSPLVCDGSINVVYVDSNSYLQYNKTALSELNVEEAQIKCQYRNLTRDPDDYTVSYTEWASFTPPMQVDVDFFEVVCIKDSKHAIFNQILTNIGRRAKQPTILPESSEQLSVVIFGMDSVSRSMSIRKLPKTTNYLKNVLHSYDFRGHMKVGENTLPNLAAMLTGLRIFTDEMPVKNYEVDRFDSVPILFSNYSDHNYATLYAEDMPKWGTFQYEAKGFEHQPTDHYMRPFHLALNAPPNSVSDVMSDVLIFLEDKHVKLNKGSSLCYGNKPKLLIQIEYLKRFVKKYNHQRRFAFSFHSELCHEYPNFLEYGDEHILSFIKWLKDDGHLENMVLIFFSDHGNRIEKIRNTFVGRIEDRMPVVHIVIPERFKSKYPTLHKSMQDNTERLTTSFDIHQTLVDVLTQNFANPTKSYINGKLRSISLFNPVPKDRTCADAWIPENYCACFMSSSVNASTDPVVKPLAAKVVFDLNNILAADPKCSQLELFQVREVRRLSEGLQYYTTEGKSLTLYSFFHPIKRDVTRYFIAIETVPGHGIFEATYEMNESGNLNIVEKIDRTNKYGNQSSCVENKKLRSFCFCKDQIPAN